MSGENLEYDLEDQLQEIDGMLKELAQRNQALLEQSELQSQAAVKMREKLGSVTERIEALIKRLKHLEDQL